MKSLPPSEFTALPVLDPPAAYICVIRDIDSDRYRIQATHSPQAQVAAVIAEGERSFGIELVALLRTDDLVASEAELYARHHARLSGEWLALDAHQVEELRRSALQIDAFASHYLTPAQSPQFDAEAPDSPAEGRPRYELLANSNSHGPSHARWKQRRPGASIYDVQYGSKALRRNRAAADARREEEERRRRERLYRLSTEDRIKEYIGEFLVKHIVAITIIVIALMLLPLAHIVLTKLR